VTELVHAEHDAADGGSSPPRAGTLQRWAYDYVVSDSLATKLAPAPVPELVLSADECAILRLARPGRPPELRVASQKIKAPRGGALRDPKKRAALLHTFLHHELQAAELMCWAVLAFADTPPSFKRGLIGICHDEIRHMQLYAAEIQHLGFKVGDFPVRDWFWQRVPAAQSPSAFVAVMGLGFEAGNLDHTQRFAQQFRAFGDERGARMQELVAHEEVAHVAFAAHWFRHFEGELSFSRWSKALPAPLSPMVMRGDPLDRNARAAAGMDETFLDALQQWQPTLASPGS
jgi:uncharacterized ferritin-like protein (DUF455 family)